MGYLWHLGLVNLMVARDFGTRGLEHEIFFTRDFLNTNRTNNTNLFGTRGFLTRGFWHTDLGFCLRHFEHEIFLHEIFLNTNNTNNTNIILHTDLTDLTDFEPSARCE